MFLICEKIPIRIFELQGKPQRKKVMNWKKLQIRALTIGAVILGSLLANSALASTYKGGGYTITIGDDLSYYGCDAQDNCLYIPYYSHQTRGHITWENSGYTYNMSPTGNRGEYRLKVYNPRGTVILQQVVNPITEVQQQYQVLCDVDNLRQGQLALRNTPNGEARAGLNNGNIVRSLHGEAPPQGIWKYVEVIAGPNSRVEGLKGWVNSNYLICYDDA